MTAVLSKGVVEYEDGDGTDNDINTLPPKRARVCEDKLLNTAQPTGARVLLRHVYFLHEERSRYVSVGFYPSENYQVLIEFGGSRIAPITLTEHHFRTLVEALPTLCAAMQHGELYTRKDGAFRLRSIKTNNFARLYRAKSVSVLLLLICAIC